MAESNLYIRQKNPNDNIILKPLDVERYMGVLIYSSVLKASAFREYWSPFVNATFITQTVRCKKFEKIRTVLHFNNNDEMILDKTNPKYD